MNLYALKNVLYAMFPDPPPPDPKKELKKKLQGGDEEPESSEPLQTNIGQKVLLMD